MHSKISVRTLAVTAALGVAVTVGTAGVTPALATPAITSGSQSQVSTIDHSVQGSITVHKRDLNDATPVDPTGNPGQNAPGEALAGATFELYRIETADLTTNGGFAEASKLDATGILATELTLVDSGTSTADGTVQFGGLDVGVYLLRESGAPVGYTPAQDSLIFLPMTDPDNNNEWNYNVHVYPKNSKMTADKTVKDAGKNVGDRITYQITTSIPYLTREETTISKYEIHDDLDEKRLAPEMDGFSVGLNDGTTFEFGHDYELVGNADELSGTVNFLQPGLEKLTGAKINDPSTKVVTTIGARVIAIGGGGGKVTNQATVISNNGGGGGDTTLQTNPVESFWGKLRVNKTGEDNERLDGAKFQLYRCTDQDNLDGPLTVGGEDEWTTEEGTFTIDALHVTDVENSAEIDPTDKYCLVETRAPQGYELLPDPVEIDFTRAAVAGTSDVAGDDEVTLVAEIENIKSVSASLPLTGGAGVGLLAALGALIIGAGAWIARRLNRA